MYMFKVESIATEHNTVYDAGDVIFRGVEGDTCKYFVNHEDAFVEAVVINDDAQSFVNVGYTRNFFGRISYVYVPVDEMAEIAARYGADAFRGAYDIVIGD